MATDSVVLEEEIDPNYEPTQDEVRDYARWLGMDLVEDADLMWIAREGLKAPLPEHWKPCKTLDTGEIYYFNFQSGESTWDHPCDAYYRNLYDEEKNKSNRRRHTSFSRESGTRQKRALDEVRGIVKQQKESIIDEDVRRKVNELKPGKSVEVKPFSAHALGTLGRSSGSLNGKSPLPNVPGRDHPNQFGFNQASPMQRVPSNSDFDAKFDANRWDSEAEVYNGSSGASAKKRGDRSSRRRIEMVHDDTRLPSPSNPFQTSSNDDHLFKQSALPMKNRQKDELRKDDLRHLEDELKSRRAEMEQSFKDATNHFEEKKRQLMDDLDEQKRAYQIELSLLERDKNETAQNIKVEHEQIRKRYARELENLEDEKQDLLKEVENLQNDFDDIEQKKKERLMKVDQEVQLAQKKLEDEISHIETERKRISREEKELKERQSNLEIVREQENSARKDKGLAEVESLEASIKDRRQDLENLLSEISKLKRERNEQEASNEQRHREMELELSTLLSEIEGERNLKANAMLEKAKMEKDLENLREQLDKEEKEHEQSLRQQRRTLEEAKARARAYELRRDELDSQVSHISSHLDENIGLEQIAKERRAAEEQLEAEVQRYEEMLSKTKEEADALVNQVREEERLAADERLRKQQKMFKANIEQLEKEALKLRESNPECDEADSELETKRQHIKEEFEIEKARFENDLKAAREEVHALGQTKINLEQELERVQTMLRSGNEEFSMTESKLKETISRLRTQLTDLQADLASEQASRISFESRLAAMQLEQQATLNEMEHSEDDDRDEKLKSFRSTLRGYEAQIEELQKQLERSIEALRKKEEECGRLEQNLDGASDREKDLWEKVKQLENSSAVSETRVHELESEISSLRKTMTETKVEAKEREESTLIVLENEREQTRVSNEKIAILERNLQSLKLEKEGTDALVDSLKTKLEESQVREQESADLLNSSKLQLGEASDSLRLKETQLTSLERRLREAEAAANAEAQVPSSPSSSEIVRSLHTQVHNLREDLIRERTEFDQILNSQRAKEAELSRELLKQKQEASVTKRKLESAEQDRTFLDDKMGGLKAELEQASHSLQSLENKNRQLHFQASESERVAKRQREEDVAQLQLEYEEKLQALRDSSNEQVAVLREKLGKLDQERNSFQRKVGSLQKDKEDLESKIAQLSTALDTTEDSTRSLVAGKKAIELKNESLEKRLANLTGQFASLQESISKTEQERDNAQSDLFRAKQDTARALGDVTSLQRRSIILEEKLSKSETQIRDLEEQLSSAPISGGGLDIDELEQQRSQLLKARLDLEHQKTVLVSQQNSTSEKQLQLEKSLEEQSRLRVLVEQEANDLRARVDLIDRREKELNKRLVEEKAKMENDGQLREQVRKLEARLLLLQNANLEPTPIVSEPPSVPEIIGGVYAGTSTRSSPRGINSDPSSPRNLSNGARKNLDLAREWMQSSAFERALLENALDLLKKQEINISEQRGALRNAAQTPSDSTCRFSSSTQIKHLLIAQVDQMTESLGSIQSKSVWIDRLLVLFDRVSSAAVSAINSPDDSSSLARFQALYQKFEILEDEFDHYTSTSDGEYSDNGASATSSNQNSGSETENNSSRVNAHFPSAFARKRRTRNVQHSTPLAVDGKYPFDASYLLPQLAAAAAAAATSAAAFPTRQQIPSSQMPFPYLPSVVYLDENGNVLGVNTRETYHPPQASVLSRNKHVSSGFRRSEDVSLSAFAPSYNLRESGILPETAAADVGALQAKWEQQRSIAAQHSAWLSNFGRQMQQSPSARLYDGDSDNKTRRRHSKSSSRINGVSIKKSLKVLTSPEKNIRHSFRSGRR